MPLYELISEEASIAFVGSFNPAIFHPEWLARHNLIPQDDIKGAHVEIVHNDISKFSLEWLSADILRDKFLVRTNDPAKFSPLKDLMISVFGILDHTPIKHLGMNLVSKYKIEAEDNWHKVGDSLVPKNVWEKSLPKRVGLTSLQVMSPREDSLPGHLNVLIRSVRNDFFGVEFNINSHVDLKSHTDDNEEIIGVPSILGQYWDSSLSLARNIGGNTLKEILV